MSEFKKIILPKGMTLVDRITGVSREITKWLDSLDEPFDVDRDTMHLVKCERNDNYSYHYILDRAVKEPNKRSGSRKPAGEAMESEH